MQPRESTQDVEDRRGGGGGGGALLASNAQLGADQGVGDRPSLGGQIRWDGVLGEAARRRQPEEGDGEDASGLVAALLRLAELDSHVGGRDGG